MTVNERDGPGRTSASLERTYLPRQGQIRVRQFGAGQHLTLAEHFAISRSAFTTL